MFCHPDQSMNENIFITIYLTILYEQILVRWSNGENWGNPKILWVQQVFATKSFILFHSLKLTLCPLHAPNFINDSLCTYYEKLWAKCKSLCGNKFIHGLWVSYGSKKIKILESSLPVTITHNADLEKIFAGNRLLKDNSEHWDDSNKL